MHETVNKCKIFGASVALSTGEHRRICAPFVAREAEDMTFRTSKTVHAIDLLALLIASDEHISSSRIDLPLAIDTFGEPWVVEATVGLQSCHRHIVTILTSGLSEFDPVLIDTLSSDHKAFTDGRQSRSVVWRTENPSLSGHVDIL